MIVDLMEVIDLYMRCDPLSGTTFLHSTGQRDNNTINMLLRPRCEFVGNETSQE